MKAKFVSVLLIIAMLAGILTTAASAAAPTTDEIVEKAADIICSREGTYTSVAKDDNGALSIGCLQWHGNRALNLLRSIINANTANAKTILGDTLYNEIMTTSSWSTRILTADEASKIEKLLGTDEGKAEQDELLENDVLSYIEHGRKLGITSPAALVYFADIENQCGSGGATRVYNAALVISKGNNVTLAILHQAALEDSSAGDYPVRRNSVYDYAYQLDWEDTVITEAYEIWKTDYTLNVREGAGTSYQQISQYQANTQVIVYEQTLVDGEKWGRTSIGWICLEYCTFVSSHDPSANAFPITFDANGGELATKPKLSTKITAINVSRPANGIVVYTNERGTTTRTNEYGGEAVIGADGYAQNTPVYGINNSTIPTGGFVVSGHDAGLKTINNGISKGDYVVYSKNMLTLESYKDYQSYIAANKKAANGSPMGTLPIPERKGYTFDGWYTDDGQKVTKDTVVTQSTTFTLTAKWSPVTVSVSFDLNNGTVDAPTLTTKANGVNTYRFEDYLVVYDSTYGSTTKTNAYGSEAVVDSAGIVTKVCPILTDDCYNNAIPKDGFVLSGHDIMSTWIINNIEAGDRIEFDKSTMLVSVYKNGAGSIAPITATYGQTMGDLPTPERKGYTFDGWFTSEGTKVTKDTVVTVYTPFTLKAEWSPVSVNVSFDLNGGTMGTANTTVTANGCNTQRLGDYLVVYDSSFGSAASTNQWGTEVIVDSIGIVTAVRVESGGNAIPEGGLVISGHGKMAAWINSNIKTGDRIEFNKNTLLVSVFRHGGNNTNTLTVTYDAKIGALPTPTKENCLFDGWTTKDGTKITADTVSAFTESLTLYAQWKPDDGEADTHIIGDVNEDGEVDSRDMVCIRIALNKDGINTYKYADVNEDGDVDSRDLVALRRIINS